MKQRLSISRTPTAGAIKVIAIVASLVALFLGVVVSTTHVNALIPPPDPESGSVGVEGTIQSPPPTQAATIVSPANGQVFTTIPITVSGLCPKDVLVKVFSNNIFVGSTMCVGGSFTLQVSLFSGRNDLVARVFDALDQQGPDSNVVTVTFNDAQYASFGTHVLLTSQYARRGADPGKKLTWPTILSGGVGPYALTAEWSDGKPSDLRSESFPGVLSFAHTYKSAGTYNVIFKAVDNNKTAAYLQVVAVIAGTAKDGGAAGTDDKTIVKKEIIWWPAAIMLLFVLAGFWLGRRYELASLRKRLERQY